ncbi:MAG TPA: prolyl oligopeptidase family serine peptidase [Thermoanaerobaculia bacterium]|nr:prolyl oligopeptidase family serine peptidase [Thermoanaerobaculia bacterium]
MTRNPRLRFAAIPLSLLLALPLGAAPPATPAASTAAPPLTLERIMADPDWIGNPPEGSYWADDGRSVYYERERDGEGKNPKDLYRVDLATGQAVKVDPADRGRQDAPGGDRSRDRKWKVYAREGDVFLKDLTTGAVRQVTRTAERETDPRFLADGQRIGFRRGPAVFVYDLASGLTSQPAEIRLETDPAEKDDPTYLAAEQTRLFDVIRQKQEREKRDREEERANQKADPTRPPLPWYFGKKVTIESSRLSPTGNWLAVVTAPKRDDQLKPSKMPSYVTESGEVETRDVRSKVGAEGLVPHSVVLLDLVKHRRLDLDLSTLPGIKEDPLKHLKDAARARREAEKAKKAAAAKEAAAKDEEKEVTSRDKEEATQEEEKGKDKDAKALAAKAKEKTDQDKDKEKEQDKDKAKKPEPRPVEVQGLTWSEDGSQLAVMLRSRDNKDRWIAIWDAASRKLTPRHRLTDPAWINWEFNVQGWLKDNETLYFLSEEGGWSRLYLLSTRPGQSGKLRPLTPEGHFEVGNPVRSWDGRYIYYQANVEHPGNYDVWRVEVATGKTEQLTHLGGLTGFALSPDEDQLLLDHSGTTRPDELYVQAVSGGEARQVTQTRTAAFLAEDWAVPEVVPIPSTHGAPAPIYSRVYTPKDFAPSRRYPAVMFVHGAGYLQNVHFGWSSYFREFMFHTLLTRHGYVVIDMDYRASAGYGRAWRTAIYRQMGHPELEDLQDGVAWLAAHKSVDPQRVGVYGGSYGGFMTYMALFRAPDLFAAGAALRPVSDWTYYNDDYTSNILNRPEDDPDAYTKSSPIEYVAGLRKPLLICDGMLDDNVFFQDNVRLVQRLIELKKENFETAIYPVESHGFVQPTSWLDEYRRIFKLFERTLK